MARKLAKEEGIFAGISSGAAMHVAVRESTQIAEGLIVVIIPDRGDRYLSTDLFCYNPCGNTNCKLKGEEQAVEIPRLALSPFMPRSSTYKSTPVALA